jgi:nitrite reductase/ring-hydroxylating ferredoxin subunit
MAKTQAWTGRTIHGKPYAVGLDGRQRGRDLWRRSRQCGRPRLEALSMVDSGGTSTRSPLVPGVRLRLETGAGPVALFAVGDAVYAIEDGCLRCGSTLVTGALVGRVVSCPVCGWRYDVAQGCLVGLPALRVRTFEVRATRED